MNGNVQGDINHTSNHSVIKENFHIFVAEASTRVEQALRYNTRLSPDTPELPKDTTHVDMLI